MTSDVPQRYYQTPGHVIAAGVVLSLMDIVAVLLRFKARRAGKQKLQADDWLLVPATILNTGVGICLIIGVSQRYYQTPGHVIAAGVVLSLMDIVAVLLRFKARRAGKQKLQADDWLLVPATILNTGVGICLIIGVSREAFAYRYVRLATSDHEMTDASISQVSTSIKLDATTKTHLQPTDQPQSHPS